jgi:pilus assembly protein Flp/PilA
LYKHGLKFGSDYKEKPDVITQYNFLNSWIKAHTKSERGAAMVEYALLLALIAIVAIAALKLLGETVSGEFSGINSGLNA